MKRPQEDARTASWRCIMDRCAARARLELLQDASDKRWIRSAFKMAPDAHVAGAKDLPLKIDKEQIQWDERIFGEDVLVRIWVTMGRAPHSIGSLLKGNVVDSVRAIYGHRLYHPQYEEQAKLAARDGLAADHALIEFRKPAKGGEPGQSWSIGFAGKGGWLGGLDKLFRTTNRMHNANTKKPLADQLPAVLIGMGKITPASKRKMEKLLEDAETVLLEEHSANDDYRIYLQYNSDSPLSKYTRAAWNSEQNVSNCIGFAKWLFPDVVQCPTGKLLVPGACFGVVPDDLGGGWCQESEKCVHEQTKPEGQSSTKRRRMI